MKRVRLGRCVPGILALLKVAGRPYQKASAGDFGFAVGPRLNAAGRLTDMTLGIECLLSDEVSQALEMATTLDALNRERREIQIKMQDSVIDEMPELESNNLPHGLCLYSDDWHQGVIGILASRIREKWHRPVIAFAREGDNKIKGSGRSISAVHLRDVLENIAARNPGLIDKYGGHAMAAGLTIEEKDFDLFRRCFEKEMQERLSIDDLEGVILSDGELQAGDINLALAAAIREGGPWGNGFPEPVFDGLFQLSDRRIVGDNHLKMTIGLPGAGRVFDAIAFFTRDENWPGEVSQVQLAYRLDINEFNGRRTAQLIVEYVEPVCK